MLLKRSGERWHPFLVPDLSGKSSSFSPLSTMSATGFFRKMFSIRLRKFSSIPSLLRAFIMNGCWILSNSFSIFIDMTIGFFFSLLIWQININWFLELSCANFLSTVSKTLCSQCRQPSSIPGQETRTHMPQLKKKKKKNDLALCN